MTSDNPCAIRDAHKRLYAAHRHWHECLLAYHEPDDFVVALNACIQALRNVTFSLQKQRDSVPGFDQWYVKQQEWMRGKRILRWIVDSRNRIVKEGDLETESVSIWQVVADHSDAAALMKRFVASNELPSNVVRLPATASANEFAAKEIGQRVPPALLSNASLVVERRWVDSALHGRELLDALADAYVMLEQVLVSAHLQLGVDYESCGSRIQLHNHEVHLGSGRLRCMLVSRRVRTISLELASGAPEEQLAFVRVERDEEHLAKAISRYGELEPLPQVESIHQFIEPLMERAKAVVAADPFHLWTVQLYRGVECIDVFMMEPQDRRSLRHFMLDIAEQVQRLDADGIICIGEMWYSPQDTDDAGMPIAATDHPDRREALLVDSETADGVHQGLLMVFDRIRPGEVTFAEPTRSSLTADYLMPIRTVWKQTNAAE